MADHACLFHTKVIMPNFTEFENKCMTVYLAKGVRHRHILPYIYTFRFCVYACIFIIGSRETICHIERAGVSWADLCLSTDVDSWHRLTITSIPLSDSDWNHVTGAPSFKPIAQHDDASQRCLQCSKILPCFSSWIPQRFFQEPRPLRSEIVVLSRLVFKTLQPLLRFAFSLPFRSGAKANVINNNSNQMIV